METTFSLNGRALKLDNAEDMKEHTAAIEAMERVERVVLSGNTIGIGAAQELGKALAKLEHLKELDLADAFTGRLRDEIPDALGSILDSVVTKSTLEKVNLSDNAFGPTVAETLYKFLSRHYYLKELRVSNTGLGPLGGKKVAEALTVSAQEGRKAGVDPRLEIFIGGRNRLQSESCESFAKCFDAYKDTLRELVLPQNGIRPEGIIQLIEGLENCSKLQVLDLQDNTLAAAGCAAVAGLIRKLKDLRELNLGDCYLTREGAHVLCTMLTSHPPHEMRALNLQYVEMDEESCLILVGAVKKMPLLKHLELNGNNFAADCAAVDALRDALGEDVLGSLDDMEVD